MLKRGSIGWTIWNSIESLILIAGGILCCIYCANANFQKTALLIVGILIMLDAALRLTLGVIDVIRIGNHAIVKTDYLQAFTGSLELALGIVLVLTYAEKTSLEVVFKFVGLFLGILLITLGTVALIYAIAYIVKKLNTLMNNIVSVIGGLLVIAVGILAIIYLTRQDTIMTVFLVVLGIMLIASGIGLLALTVAVARGVKKVKNFVKEVKSDVAVEAESTPKEEDNTTTNSEN